MVVSVDFKVEIVVKDFVWCKKKLISYIRIFIVFSLVMFFYIVEKLFLFYWMLNFGIIYER